MLHCAGRGDWTITSEILALLIGNGLKYFEITSGSGCVIYGGKALTGGGGVPPLQTAESRWRKNEYNKQKGLFVSIQKNFNLFSQIHGNLKK
jgi:hypothetical protein